MNGLYLLILVATSHAWLLARHSGAFRGGLTHSCAFPMHIEVNSRDCASNYIKAKIAVTIPANAFTLNSHVPNFIPIEHPQALPSPFLVNGSPLPATSTHRKSKYKQYNSHNRTSGSDHNQVKKGGPSSTSSHRSVHRRGRAYDNGASQLQYEIDGNRNQSTFNNLELNKYRGKRHDQEESMDKYDRSGQQRFPTKRSRSQVKRRPPSYGNFLKVDVFEHDNDDDIFIMKRLNSKPFSKFQERNRMMRLNGFAWWISDSEDNHPRVLPPYKPWWLESNFAVDDSWTVVELREEATRRGLVTHGLKSELIDRINLSHIKYSLLDDNFVTPTILPTTDDEPVYGCFPEVYEKNVDTPK